MGHPVVPRRGEPSIYTLAGRAGPLRPYSGHPWSQRSPSHVAPSTAASFPQRSVEELLSLDEASRRSSSALKKRSVFEVLAEEADDLTVPMLVVGVAGIAGIVIGRYLR